jgi:ATP synthase protein I
MAKPDPSDHAALADLDKRLAAFEADRKSPAISARSYADGYRFLAGILGGVLGGLGLGWLVDHYAGTSPLGMVVGLVVGIGFSGYAIVRSASRMSRQASKEAGPLPSIPDDED